MIRLRLRDAAFVGGGVTDGMRAWQAVERTTPPGGEITAMGGERRGTQQECFALIRAGERDAIFACKARPLWAYAALPRPYANGPYCRIRIAPLMIRTIGPRWWASVAHCGVSTVVRPVGLTVQPHES